MKKSTPVFLLLLACLIIPFSCKKYIEQQQKNAIIELVTSGTWRVTGYMDHQTVNLTDSFSGYSFQFYENGTVYGTHSGKQTNGTWSADVGTKSITSNFPSATFPYTLLNYTWTITDSYTDSVAARTPVDATYNILNLHKN